MHRLYGMDFHTSSLKRTYIEENIKYMNLKNLPLGISTLSLLLESNGIYVDKTEYAFNLIKSPGRFLLSRPRRFGKSLFVDTLKEIFEGNQKLFEGLYIYDKWDWTKKYPVIKFDFAEGMLKSGKDLDEKIHEILLFNEENLGVSTVNKSISGRFADLIKGAREKYGQRVVVLFDDYEKPIFDNIGNLSTAKELLFGLNNLFSVFKSQDANLQFIFMTGVTKFLKGRNCSGLNHLNDITISQTYSSVFGFTEKELQHYFGEYFAGCDPEEVKEWYYGFNWAGSESVYNPYDILLFSNKRFMFQNYWFRTGTLTYHVGLLIKIKYFAPDFENIKVTPEILDAFDIDNIDPISLLFQSGYLAIRDKAIVDQEQVFKLKFPNRELKRAFFDQYLKGLIGF